METPNSIKCRKCGGPHLTIKCGKEVKEIVPDIKENHVKRDTHETRDTRETREHHDCKDCKVRIANLPVDMTKGELYNLLEEWGHIKSLYIKENYDSTSAFVEFSTSEQSKYFVEALNETPFEYQIITVEIMTN